MGSSADFAREREAMIDRQLRRRGIADAGLLEAFRRVPREAFVAAGHADLAYGDHPLPIECGQTISQPYIVALMIEAAQVRRDDRVLEVGAGSGYAAALLGLVAGQVTAVERHGELARLAEWRMARLGYDNVRIVEGDGTLGWPDAAPFDVIVASAGGGQVPPSLVDQLKPGGRLVIPLGRDGGSQSLVKLTKRADGGLEQQTLCAVRFVPLVGAE